jgi:D-amino-acid dehydrogenase
MRVAVVGAGVIGVTTAFELHRDGHDVVVVERHDGAADETSFANAGLIAPGHSFTWSSPQAPKVLVKSLYSRDQSLRFKLRADPDLYAWSLRFLRNCTPARARTNTLRKLGLCVYSQERLHEILGATNVAYDGISKGLLYLYRDPAAFEAGVEHMKLLQEGGQRIEVLDVDGCVAAEPALATARAKLAGGIRCPDDESGDAHLFSRGLADWLAGRGVEFRYGTTVLGVGTSGDRIVDVRTSRGPLEADAYVFAVGCSAAAIGKKIGLRLPVYPIKGYSVTVPIADDAKAPTVGGVDEQNLVAFARFGARMRLTSTAEFAGYDTSYEPSDFDAMLRAARELFPGAAAYEQGTFWAGLRPMTPEGTPIIGRGKQRNAWVSVGHGHMGWTMAAGSARILADMLKGQPTAIDITGMTLAGA